MGCHHLVGKKNETYRAWSQTLKLKMGPLSSHSENANEYGNAWMC